MLEMPLLAHIQALMLYLVFIARSIHMCYSLLSYLCFLNSNSFEEISDELSSLLLHVLFPKDKIIPK